MFSIVLSVECLRGGKVDVKSLDVKRSLRMKEIGNE